MPSKQQNVQSLAFDDVVNLLKSRYMDVVQISSNDLDPELVKLGGRVYAVKVSPNFGFITILFPPSPSSSITEEFAFLCDTDIEVQEELVIQINNKLEWVQAILVPENEGDSYGHLSFFAAGVLKEGIKIDEFHNILDFWQHELAVGVEFATSDSYEDKAEPSDAILNTLKSDAVKSFMANNDAKKALSSGDFKPHPQKITVETQKKRFGLF